MQLPETLSTLPMNRKIPILLFIVSMFGAMIIAGISHYSINKTSQKNANRFWQQQIPTIKSLITPALKRKNLKNQKEAIKKIFSILVQRSPRTRVMLLKYANSRAPYGKLALLAHSRDDINLFLETSRKNKDAKMEDVESIKLTTIPVLEQRLNDKDLEVSSLSGSSSIIIPVNTNDNFFVLYIQAKFTSYYDRLILLYLIAVLISLLITLVGILLVKEAEEPLKKVVESLFSFVTYGSKSRVSYKSGDKVGLLLEKYNDLLEDLEVDIPSADLPSRKQVAHSSMLAELPSSANGLQSVQKKLFEKPFMRLSDFQITMYPKNPLDNEKNFVGGKQDDKKLNLLMGYFDESSVDAGLEKSRIQEQFIALTESHVSPDAIALRTWKKFSEISQYRPGMLFVSLDATSRDQLTIYRSGKYHLFLCDYIESDKEESTLDSEKVGLGSLDFTSSYMGLQSLKLNTEKKLLIISNEILDILELNSDLFIENVLNNIVLSEQKWHSARQFMATVLTQVYSLLDNTWRSQKIPGVITLINLRG